MRGCNINNNIHPPRIHQIPAFHTVHQVSCYLPHQSHLNFIGDLLIATFISLWYYTLSDPCREQISVQTRRENIWYKQKLSWNFHILFYPLKIHFRVTQTGKTCLGWSQSDKIVIVLKPQHGQVTPTYTLKKTQPTYTIAPTEFSSWHRSLTSTRLVLTQKRKTVEDLN